MRFPSCLAALVLCLQLLASEGPPVVSRVVARIPTKAEVGAGSMPADIAPVSAPFAMPDLKRPTFPANIANIIDFGAKPGASARLAIQAAIEAIAAKGGGRVLIPAGVWQTGRIELKSQVELHLAEGAELHFSGELEDYQPAVFTRNEGVEVMSLGALIYANGQDKIAVTGRGKLIGPPLECPLRKRIVTSDVIEKVIPADMPVEKRLYDGAKGGDIFPLMFISPINCTRVFIEGVTLEHTPFWNIVPIYCDQVIIRGVTVNSVGIPRSDGIDIDSSRNVLIEYSTLNCGDDCFTLKAGRNEDGLRVNKPTENVVVRFCLARQGHGGITLGSETAGMIRNLYLHDSVFDGTGSGIRFKTRRPRGGGGEKVLLERIRMERTEKVIVADMLGSPQFVGELAVRLPARPVTPLTPVFRNIVVRDLVVTDGGRFLDINGIPESPFSGFLLENAEVSCAKLGRMTDARDIVFRNVSIQAKDTTENLTDVDGYRKENVNVR